MPSRADRLLRLRIRLEALARGVLLLALAWLLIRSLRQGDGQEVRADVAGLRAALTRWSTRTSPAGAQVRVDGPIASWQRDWLGALADLGTNVQWSGRGVVPVAATAEAVADPLGATRVLVAAPKGSAVSVADDFGPLGDVHTTAPGARFLARSAPGDVSVRVGALTARAVVAESLVLGRLLVLGGAGWESKFVTAAMEERGWRVDARLALGPKGSVVQGGVATIDTSRYAAVIALDSTALAFAPRLVRYVRSGGGLILASPPSGARALADLGAGAPRQRLEATMPFDTMSPEPRRALALVPVALKDDALPLERRDTSVALAVRRAGRGRVLVVGYADTWRWRLAGGADAVEQHRAWWSDLVATVAYAGRRPRPTAAAPDEAPLARLVDRLGPASAAGSGGGPSGIAPGWLFALLLALLLGEVASRRLRGAA